MKEKILLTNRYRDKNYLVPREDGLYEFELEYNYGLRVISDRYTNEICAIDPSGGPFISKGEKLEDFVHKKTYTIVSLCFIDNKYCVELRESKHNKK